MNPMDEIEDNFEMLKGNILEALGPNPDPKKTFVVDMLVDAIEDNVSAIKAILDQKEKD